MALINVALQSNGGIVTADNYSSPNIPANINDGSYITGNGRNWYGGTKVMITFNKTYTISQLKLFTTDNWGYSFDSFDVYYSTNAFCTINTTLASFYCLGTFTGIDCKNKLGGITFSPVNALNVLLIPRQSSPAISELEIYAEQINPSFSGNLSLSNVHNSDVQLSGTITSQSSTTVKYKISLNGTQIYPTSGYTTFASSPINVNYTIKNNLLTQLTNVITINCIDSNGLTCTNSYNVSVYNSAPTGILTSSNTIIHGQDINITGTLSDTDLDKISYRILLNYVELQTWSTFIDNPTINYIIQNNLLNMGDNTITIEYKDNFKNSLTNIWNQIITKTNNTSIINIQYINGSVMGIITDPDSDLTQYKILINGNQKYPETGFTNFELNSTINYQINRNDILIGKDNIITIIAQDSFNSEISQEISFIGEYIGLMFMDENKKFYTSDIGELLKYLDFGTITLGQITEPVKILVQNKFGFPIKDINLTIDNQLENIVVELCKETNPFIANNNLILENSYNPDDIDYFHIRLNTCISQNSTSGTFRINAKATSIN